MNSIPDAWPPGPAPVMSVNSVPMFPLPGVFLFPGQLMPLHIFEPRYQQMIEDSLDTSGRLVIGTVLEAHHADLANAPPVVPIAGLGEIGRHERLPDGRFLIWLCGIGRVQIEEADSDRLYRRVRTTPLIEFGPSPSEDAELRPLLLEAIERRTGADLGEHDSAPLGALADVLAQCTTAPEAVVLGLHGEVIVAERARKALAAERRFPSTRR